VKRSIRRSVLLLLCAACFACGMARAEPFPDRPIRWVVPYPAGGTTDVIARLVAQAITQADGYTIVIDNRAGAGGQIAMNAVAKAAPDGYMLLVSDAWPLRRACTSSCRSTRSRTCKRLRCSRRCRTSWW
jgi:tripartite-type tricarboxylate transporter receptor subunit TctC